MTRGALDQVVTVAQREFDTVVRTRLLLLLFAGYLALVFGLAWLSATGTYLSLLIDLLTPMEALVPVLAFALGYRSILADRERGELETLQTYPLSPARYVIGVYVGRAVPLVAVVLASLVGPAALVSATQQGEVATIAAHGTVDSPTLFVRFALLTVAFALVALAVALLVSAAARSARAGLALAAVTLLALVVGIDSGLVAAVTDGAVSPGGATWLLALSPNSAYRSLVFEFTLAPIGAATPPAAGVLASTIGLLAWTVLALLGARLLTWRGR